MSRDLVERQEIIDRLDRVIEKGLVNILSGEHPITAEVMKEVIMALPSAEPDTTLLAQKIWTKVCMITDPEDANLQHEVIHYGDLKKVFLEVLGWTI